MLGSGRRCTSSAASRRCREPIRCGRRARSPPYRSSRFPPAGEDVVATPKERTKQGNLFGIRERRRSRCDVRHLRRRRGLHLNRGALLQLLKRSKNAHALAIELSETVLEICNLFISGVVHCRALSRLRDKLSIIRFAHALCDPLQRIAGTLMLVAVDDRIFSCSVEPCRPRRAFRNGAE